MRKTTVTAKKQEISENISQESAKATPNRRTNKMLLNMVYIAVFTALIAVCSQICIPTPPGIPPVTMQTFAVFLAASMLGWKHGTLSVLIYLLLGLIGIPVFAQFQSGLGTLLGMTGGYLIGFLFTSVFTGLLCEKLGRKVWVLIVSMIGGLLLCYVFGTAWFMVVYGQQVGAISLWAALTMCVFPFLPFDAGKILVATILVNRLDKHIKL